MPREHEDFLQRAVGLILGSLDIERVLDNSLTFLRGYMPVDQLDLSVLNEEECILDVVAHVSRSGPHPPGKTRTIPRDRSEFLSLERFGLEGIRVINHPSDYPTMREFLGKRGETLDFSGVFMELPLEDGLSGSLAVKAHGEGRYTRRHAELLTLLRETFAVALSNALKHREILRLKDMLDEENRLLQEDLRRMSGGEIVGADFGLREVMELIGRVAPLDSPVLLFGETGVGKEVLADAIHLSSPRREGPMIKVNCGAIPESLLDSELFGHEKGAFTGALETKRGRFERAHGGTIFLDEVGELPPQAQVRLLRVLQNKEIERVGGGRPIPVDIRVVSATHRNLEEMVSRGAFREDLWFRLNVFPIIVPPLRQRKDDIPALAHHFLEAKARDLKLKETPRLAPGSMGLMTAYGWPGNVRELENLVERALIQQRGGLVDFRPYLTPRGAKAPEDSPAPGAGEPLATLDQAMTRHINLALSRAGGKISGPGGAAELLGLHPNTLRKKMLRLGIPFGREAARD